MPLDSLNGWGGIGHNSGAGGGGNRRGGMFTYDSSFYDSTGAFLIGELERLDQTIHDPLYSVTWGRDIDLREDVTIGDEVSSFTNSSFAVAGGINPAGINWIGKNVNTISGAQLDIGKTPQPLFLWGMEVSYTQPELQSAQRVGRPIDDQKYQVMRVKHLMDTDQLVYLGDATLGTYGLINHPSISVANVTGGAWSAATPDAIIAQVNEILATTWQNSGYAQAPDQLRVPPQQFGLLVSTKVSTAGNISTLRYLQENTICNTQNGKPLNIQPLKWLSNAGVGSANRMLAYTKQYDRVRFPMTPLSRTPLEWRSIYNITTYYGRLGVIEVVYPETLLLRDGI
jgi:hypothetical protein